MPKRQFCRTTTLRLAALAGATVAVNVAWTLRAAAQIATSPIAQAVSACGQGATSGASIGAAGASSGPPADPGVPSAAPFGTAAATSTASFALSNPSGASTNPAAATIAPSFAAGAPSQAEGLPETLRFTPKGGVQFIATDNVLETSTHRKAISSSRHVQVLTSLSNRSAPRLRWMRR
jgi:hypothetical protein